ncbi:Niemann-Pick C1 protein [Armadillidium vulgare]|nr:Niemann-Pick C1 protein [Armadillidium vulgare]
MLTALQMALSIWGTINLKQEFDIITFYPKSSYVYQILTKINQYFPHEGMRGSVYIENIDLPEELNKLQWLSQSLKENKFISKLDSWYEPFISYTIIHTGTNLEIEDVSREFFSEILGKFLFSPKGMKYQNYFYFNGSLECLEDAPEILAVKFHYVHRIINGRDDQLKAMDDVKSLVAGANFSGFSTFNSYSYINWEMNRYITMEFLQNLCLAMIAVFLMTSLLIFNLRSSFFVLFSVILTLVVGSCSYVDLCFNLKLDVLALMFLFKVGCSCSYDLIYLDVLALMTLFMFLFKVGCSCSYDLIYLDVLALMTWWGLTLETVTCINLVLTVGLSVDYSAHVTLHFMKTNGSRDERVRITLIDVGPAVFNGAFSTFLSIAFLVTSDSYVFQSFYKIFFGVFIYGLYNGLVFLPVLLSLIGSPPYAKQANKSLYSDDDQSKNEQELNNWL